MSRRLLLIDTSQRRGLVALAEDDRVVAEHSLDETRRHARDLAPATRMLLEQAGWKAQELTGVIVNRGPGSYTGLRVGIMSAKTLAYATGCALVAVDAFAVLARQAPAAAARLWVLEDAQQDKVYVQCFDRDGAGSWTDRDELCIVPFPEWSTAVAKELQAAAPAASYWVSGPALDRFGPRVPSGLNVAPIDAWRPAAASLLALGLDKLNRNQRDDPFTLEPLYLRPSQAEEQWRAKGRS